MNTTELRQKLHELIETTPETKLEAIYTVMENEIEEAQPYWEDEEFVAKVINPDRSFLGGEVKGHTPREAAEAMRRDAGR